MQRALAGGSRLVAGEAVAGQHRAGDQSGDDLVPDVGTAGVSRCWQLPAQRAGAELAGATQDRRRGNPGALAIELGPGAEPDEQDAPTVVVDDGEALGGAAGFARVQQGLQHAPGKIVRDAFVRKDADRDRVGAGGERVLATRLDLHVAARYQRDCGLPGSR